MMELEVHIGKDRGGYCGEKCVPRQLSDVLQQTESWRLLDNAFRA